MSDIDALRLEFSFCWNIYRRSSASFLGSSKASSYEFDELREACADSIQVLDAQFPSVALTNSAI